MELHDSVMRLAAQLGCEFDDVYLVMLLCTMAVFVIVGAAAGAFMDVGRLFYEKCIKRAVKKLIALSKKKKP